MKIARYKKAQKILKFFYNNYGFHQPYQVLIDGTFCFSAFKEHINIRDQLPKYLNGHVKFLSTRCIIIETEKVAKKAQGALTILKQFGIHECDHKTPVSGSECILSMVGNMNEKHYILATQDRDLQEKLKLKPGVPILYLHNKSPTLLKPSKKSYSTARHILSADRKLFISPAQDEALKNMKKVLGVDEVEQEEKPKKIVKKPHNPNPLSCKKKKNKNKGQETQGVKDGKVRKRKKNKQKQIVNLNNK